MAYGLQLIIIRDYTNLTTLLKQCLKITSEIQKTPSVKTIPSIYTKCGAY